MCVRAVRTPGCFRTPVVCLWTVTRIFDFFSGRLFFFAMLCPYDSAYICRIRARISPAVTGVFRVFIQSLQAYTYFSSYDITQSNFFI